MIMNSFAVTADGPDDTARIAAVLAERLAPGDTVLLNGDLAAGKTTFVKAVAAALGSSDLVTSPTFALAQFYSAKETPVLHIDTYRLADVEEFRDLGLDEYAETAVNLVEWGAKVAGEFPCHLSIAFEQDDTDVERRTLAFSSSCERWTSVLASLHAELVKQAEIVKPAEIRKEVP